MEMGRVDRREIQTSGKLGGRIWSKEQCGCWRNYINRYNVGASNVCRNNKKLNPGKIAEENGVGFFLLHYGFL